MTLEVKSVEYSYSGEAPTLKDITFTVRAGEVVGLIGPNGSGKSTLLRCVVGILHPQSGSIRLNERDIRALGPNEKARMVGYVPQIENRGFPATVFDTILMGRKPYISWAPSRKDLETCVRVMGKMDILDLALRNVNHLSSGQKQKVIIARALCQEPELILLDEPTSNLDLKHQVEVLSIICNEAKEGLSAVMAIHDLNLAMRFCDRIVVLNDGKIIAEGGPEIITAEVLSQVYGLEVSVTVNDGFKVVMPKMGGLAPHPAVESGECAKREAREPRAGVIHDTLE